MSPRQVAFRHLKDNWIRNAAGCFRAQMQCGDSGGMAENRVRCFAHFSLSDTAARGINEHQVNLAKAWSDAGGMFSFFSVITVSALFRARQVRLSLHPFKNLLMNKIIFLYFLLSTFLLTVVFAIVFKPWYDVEVEYVEVPRLLHLYYTSASAGELESEIIRSTNSILQCDNYLSALSAAKMPGDTISDFKPATSLVALAVQAKRFDLYVLFRCHGANIDKCSDWIHSLNDEPKVEFEDVFNRFEARFQKEGCGS